MISSRTAARVAAIAGLALTGAALAGPADAAAQTFREHDSFDPTGSVFACSTGDLTVTGGMVDEVFAGSLDANGVSHFTGTIVTHDVTLTDGSATYYLSGASWFGATGSDPDNPTVATSTDHFVIRTASGGVFAKVSVVEHVSPDGGYWVKDTGVCEEPND